MKEKRKYSENSEISPKKVHFGKGTEKSPEKSSEEGRNANTSCDFSSPIKSGFGISNRFDSFDMSENISSEDDYHDADHIYSDDEFVEENIIAAEIEENNEEAVQPAVADQYYDILYDDENDQIEQEIDISLDSSRDLFDRSDLIFAPQASSTPPPSPTQQSPPTPRVPSWNLCKLTPEMEAEVNEKRQRMTLNI